MSAHARATGCPVDLVQVADCRTTVQKDVKGGGSNGHGQKRKAVSPEAFLSEEERTRMQFNKAVAVLRREMRLKRGLALPPLGEGPSLTMPPMPSCFRGWAPPPCDVSLLRVLNPHARDKGLSFDAVEHKYFIGGIETDGSVTQVVHLHCNPFDAEHVVAKMQNGPWWPRPGYLRDQVSQEALEFLRVEAPEIFGLWCARPRCEPLICEKIRFLVGPVKAALQQLLTLDEREILAYWRCNAQEAAGLGVHMHFLFELYLNRGIVPIHSMEFRLLMKFLSQFPSLRAFRSEWAIFAEPEMLAGTIDFVAVDERGWLVLVDWKRTKDIKHKYSNPFQKMLPPLEVLDDCIGNHYRLQLNIYKYILERYYRHRVCCMLVVCCHPDTWPDGFVDEVPNMGLHVQKLMLAQRRKNRFLAQQIPYDFLDRNGGSMSSLPYEVLRQMLACMEPLDLSELLCVQSNWRNLIFDPSTWRGQIVDLSCVQLNTPRKKALVKRLAHAWAHVLRLILAQHQLPVLQPLSNQAVVSWPATFYGRRWHRYGAWFSKSPLFGFADWHFDGGSVSSLWIGFSTASCPAQFSSSTSLWCSIQAPFKPNVQLSPSFHLTEQDPLEARVVGKGPRMKQAGSHHIAAAWNGKQFRIKIDGLAFQTCNVKTAVVSPPSHAHAFVFFVRERNAVRGRVKPGPSSISPSAQPLCPLCSFDSQVLSEVTCCLLCHTWFCSNHGGACMQCGHIDLCAACLLHHVCLRPEDSVDVGGGAGKSEAAQTFHGFMVQDDGHFCRYLPMDKFGEPMVPKFLDAYNAAVWYFCGIHNGDLEVLLTSLNEHPALPADLLGHILLFCLRSGRCPETWVPFALLAGILSHARLSCKIGIAKTGNGQSTLVWNTHPWQTHYVTAALVLKRCKHFQATLRMPITGFGTRT